MQTPPSKKILILMPMLADANQTSDLLSSLAFLKQDYQLELLDPLNTNLQQTANLFYSNWQSHLRSKASDYDAAIGFSLGGTLLAYDLELWHKTKLILISTPIVTSPQLINSLTRVKQCCQHGDLNKAFRELYQAVHHPLPFNGSLPSFPNQSLSQQRLTYGIDLICQLQLQQRYQQQNKPHVHLLGEQSQLVQRENVLEPAGCQLHLIPSAGMRVLEQAPGLCQRIILEHLHGLSK